MTQLNSEWLAALNRQENQREQEEIGMKMFLNRPSLRLKKGVAA